MNNRATWVRVGLISAAVAGALLGCGTPPSVRRNVENPMHASLDWLTFESDTSVINQVPQHPLKKTARALGWFFLTAEYENPNQWNQRSIVSIAGNLPIQDVGHLYYWEEAASPVQSLLLAKGRAHWREIILKPDAKNKDHIYKARGAMSALQNATADAFKLTVELAALASITNATTVQSNRIVGIAESLKELNSQIDSNRAVLIESLNKPGIVVWRWVRTHEGKGSIVAADYGSYSREDKYTESGFSILNGLKLKVLDISKTDVSQWAKPKQGIRRKHQYLVPTYLLQAQDVVYVRDLEVLKRFALDIDIGKIARDLSTGKIDSKFLTRLQLSLQASSATLSQLSTFGGVGSWTTADSSDPGTNQQPGESWATVYAVLTEPQALVKPEFESAGEAGQNQDIGKTANEGTTNKASMR